MKARCIVTAAALIALLLVGCASIMAGSDQSVAVRTDPAGATVKVFDMSGMAIQQAVTPAPVILKKGSGYFQGATYRLEISKPGYKTQEVVIRSTLNAGWYLLGNFIVGGLIGWLIVDPMTGAMWTLAPEEIGVTLPGELSQARPQQGPQADGPLELHVALLSDIPAAARTRLLPVRQ